MFELIWSFVEEPLTEEGSVFEDWVEVHKGSVPDGGYGARRVRVGGCSIQAGGLLMGR